MPCRIGMIRKLSFTPTSLMREVMTIKPSLQLQNHRGHTVLAYAPGSAPLVVDCGAHKGEFATSVTAAWGAKCHSIEAAPDLAAKLDVPASTTTHHFAVSGQEGEIAFQLTDNAEGSHFTDELGEGCVMVPQRHLGNFLSEVAPDGLDLLKLDIEGAEIPALESLSDAQLAGIAQITCEFHDFCGYVTPQAVDAAIARLEAAGFAVIPFSWHTRGDVLFVNRKLVPLGIAANLRIAAYRYAKGLGRILSRLGR